LALFRTPEFHRSLSREKMLEEVPGLRAEGLKGGFKYSDATMWDDVLAVETLRAASQDGAAVANYVEAAAPVWTGDRITGFRVRDRISGSEIEIRASRLVVCAGPWTDDVGGVVSPQWHRWLKPSKGVHLLFDLTRIPVSGTVVMGHPEDGRLSFVIPRKDFGPGVVIVGTTDGPSPPEAENAEIDSADVAYLMELLKKYFPKLNLTTSDILSGYVGVRPLFGEIREMTGNEGPAQASSSTALQKVSREHHIGMGPGGAVFVAGGKYTTHRRMAAEIVDYTLDAWRKDFKAGKAKAPPSKLKRANTQEPVNALATVPALLSARKEAVARGVTVSPILWERFAASALEVIDIAQTKGKGLDLAEDGFPYLAAQLRYAIRHEMVLRLEDFYLRRVPLYAARRDHGLPFGEELARVWADELGHGPAEAKAELERLRAEIEKRSRWMKGL
ncbi:MAG: glycerol-3-phosphate dehydrogenase/oxidase, partial [Bdellovibrionota bacterium]